MKRIGEIINLTKMASAKPVEAVGVQAPVKLGGIISKQLPQYDHRRIVQNAYRFKHETAFIKALRETIAILAAKTKTKTVIINPHAICDLIAKYHNVRRSAKTLYRSLWYLERNGYISAYPTMLRDKHGNFKGLIIVVYLKDKMYRFFRGLWKMVRKLAKRLPGVATLVSEVETIEKIQEEARKQFGDEKAAFGDKGFRSRVWEQIFGEKFDAEGDKDVPFWERNRWKWGRKRA